VTRRIAIQSEMETSSVRALVGLIAASLLVAVAIIADGAIARIFNGIGGLLWIGSAIYLLRSFRATPRFMPWLAAVFADCVLLVLLVKPTNLIWAIIGFGLGGALIAVLTGSQALTWSPLLPALWLPAHLLVAITRVIVRSLEGSEASVRRDPPPTAALVPFAMVVAAVAGAWIVVWIRNRLLTSASEVSPSPRLK